MMAGRRGAVAQPEIGDHPFEGGGIGDGFRDARAAAAQALGDAVPGRVVERGGPDQHHALGEGAAVGRAEEGNAQDVGLEAPQGEAGQPHVQAEQRAFRMPALARPPTSRHRPFRARSPRGCASKANT
jgi:hypothetical protein